MAEVIANWPPQKAKRPFEKQFRYPWEQWAALDEDGVGDIWLAEQGIDWPLDATPLRFRSNLVTRAKAVTAQRKKAAKIVLKPVDGKMCRVPDYVALRVKVVIMSDSQVAFQFYEGDEPPVKPDVKVAIPAKLPSRKPLHTAVTIRRHVKV